MNALPDDRAGRREWLERWAEERRAQRGPAAGPSRAEAAQRRFAFARARVRRRIALTRGSVQRRSQRLADRFLDRGLYTAGLAYEPEHEHADRNPYSASSWHLLPRALRYLGVSDRDTFVDFGCGKGRVVHQAARRPFRRVIGVEISPALAEIARANLAARRHQHRCRNVEIMVADVTEFRIPDELTIGYLYHPFEGETFEALLRGIVDSLDRHPRRVRLIYVLPVYGSQILATGRFRLLKEQRFGLLGAGRHRTAIFEGR